MPRILCIGDVHGDLGRLTELLKMLSVIDTNMKWIAEPSNTIVVQLGDQLDSLSRGTQKEWETVPDTEVIKFMDHLDRIARRSGGRVLSMLGNHELMNVMGDYSYVSAHSMDASGGFRKREHMFRYGGPMAQLLSKRNVVIKIGNIGFCHGGVLPEHLDIIRNNISVVNNATRKFLRGEHLSPYEGFVLNNDVTGFDGILWTRKYFELFASGNTEELEKIIREVCSRLEIHSIISGHNTVTQITGAVNGALWLVDAALSRAYDSRANEVLEILFDDDPERPTSFRVIRVDKHD